MNFTSKYIYFGGAFCMIIPSYFFVNLARWFFISLRWCKVCGKKAYATGGHCTNKRCVLSLDHHVPYLGFTCMLAQLGSYLPI